MPSVNIEKFGGLVPRITNPRKLPKTSAKRAQNVDLTSGDLVPIAVDPPFQSLHNADGTMKAGLSKADLTYIPKPPVVREKSRVFMCDPAGAGAGIDPPWLRIDISIWATYIDDDNVFQEVELFTDGTNVDVDYTADGFVAKTVLSGTITLDTLANIGYTIHGPVFKFTFYKDEYYRGGPSREYVYPATQNWTDPAVPSISIPLEFPISMENFEPADPGRGLVGDVETFTYGFCELTDFNVPKIEPKIVTDNDTTGYKIFSGTNYINFTFRNNYVRNSSQYAYYKQTYLDQTIGEGAAFQAIGPGEGTIILKDPLTYGSSDIPDSGRLYLKNADGENDTVVFDSYSYLPLLDQYTFNITSDLPIVYNYVEDDLVEIIDPTDTGREGPGSAESDLIRVDPGEVIELDVDNADRYPVINLYRSSDAESGYSLLKHDATQEIDPTTEQAGFSSKYALKKGIELKEFTITGVGGNFEPTGILRVTTLDADLGDQDIRYTSVLSRSAGGGLTDSVFRFEKTTLDADIAEGGAAKVYGIYADTSWDLFIRNLSTALPISGNYPQSDIATALISSIKHPGGFGILIKDNKLYPSDVARSWAIPEDYVVEFPTNIIAALISGGSVIVFTEASSLEEGKVFEVVGNNPAYLSVYELTNAHPLLNKVGLAKIGQAIFWPTYDGIAATSGGSVQVTTERYFTREEWALQLPALMDVYTSENTLWLTTAGALNWRLDLDELAKGEDPNITLTTYTAFSGEPFVWESKTFEYPRPIAYSCVRVDAEAYPVAVEFYNGAGELRHGELVMNDQVKKIRRMRSERDWYVRVHGTNTVYSVGFSTNPKELSADGG